MVVHIAREGTCRLWEMCCSTGSCMEWLKYNEQNLNFMYCLAQVSFYSFKSLKIVLSSVPVHIITGKKLAYSCVLVPCILYICVGCRIMWEQNFSFCTDLLLLSQQFYFLISVFFQTQCFQQNNLCSDWSLLAEFPWLFSVFSAWLLSQFTNITSK